MTFYFDACLSKRIAKVLHDLGEDVIGPKDVFGDESIADVDWLPVADQNGWVILTSDARIRKNPGEREIFEALNCVTIFLYEGYANQSIFLQASYITGHWQKIRSTAEHARPKTSFRMGINGSILESSEYERKREQKRSRK